MNYSPQEIIETIRMIRAEHLDIRTVTMGISLLDCADGDTDALCRKIYEKIRKKGFETTIDLDRGISELVRAAQLIEFQNPFANV